MGLGAGAGGIATELVMGEVFVLGLCRYDVAEPLPAARRSRLSLVSPAVSNM
ncbi:hypothetical protein GCM10012275_49420 [Longimycelium tulufanense]|uniref:Uncharacterized protein n=1 Tax=Longimycelium tulufanense TaxID=907463 RepID=A0A8J3CI79_9PSEU|nr:hypothetical protein [Longimycelium tulufanense]GGM72902.1 hypothetical protein GCM10012275_49420 [Longimycelium tulufanense]